MRAKHKKMWIRLEPDFHGVVSLRAGRRGMSLADHVRELLLLDVNLANFTQQIGPDHEPFVFTTDAKAS